MRSRKSAWVVWGRASGATTLFAVLGMTLVATLETLGILSVGGPALAVPVTLFGECAAGLVAVVAIGYSVRRLEPGLARNTWALVGGAVALTVVADALWAYSEIALGSELGANVGDLIYFSSYALFVAAVVRWILAYRGRVDLSWIATETVVASVAIGALAWVTLLSPVLRQLGPLKPSMIEDLIWVVLDLPMIVTPLVGLSLVLLRLKEDGLFDRWAAYYGAMLVMIAADFGFFWERSHGGWHPGSLTDFGFMTTSILLAVGALTALDIQTDDASRHPSESELAA